MKLSEMPLSYVGREVVITFEGTTLTGTLTSLNVETTQLRLLTGALLRCTVHPAEVSLDGRVNARVPYHAEVILKGNPDGSS